MKGRHSGQQEGTVIVADKLYEVLGKYLRDGKKEEFANLYTTPNPSKARTFAERDYQEYVKSGVEKGVFSPKLTVTKVIETTWEEVRKRIR